MEVDAVLRAFAGDTSLTKQVRMHDSAIISLVASIGGNRKAYRRDRSAALKRVVSEIYSSPRVTDAAKLLPSLKVIPGFALDFTTNDDESRPWDFSKLEMRQAARAKVDAEKPMVLVGSPMCTEYGAWQIINDAVAGRDDTEIRRRKAAADVHMRFVCELYELHLTSGRYFLHEHPASAISWPMPCVEAVKDLPGVDTVVGDQCQYGQQAENGNPIEKGTRWMSNSPRILEQLGERCAGRSGLCSKDQGGRHEICRGRVAKDGAIYPFQLCKAILTGIHWQLREDERLTVGMVGIHPRPDAGMTTKQLERRIERKLTAAGLFVEASDVARATGDGLPVGDNYVLGRSLDLKASLSSSSTNK